MTIFLCTGSELFLVHVTNKMPTQIWQMDAWVHCTVTEHSSAVYKMVEGVTATGWLHYNQ